MSMTTFDEYVKSAWNGWDRARDWTTARYESLRGAGPWQIAAVVALGLLAVVIVLPLAMAAVTIGLIAALIVFWIGEFVALMRISDTMFPGRYDKLVWSLLMIVLPPVGAIAFWIYRQQGSIDGAAAGAMPKPEPPWGDDEP